MNIRDLQNAIKQRALHPETREQSFFKLMEEVGQLAEALRTRARYQSGNPTITGTIDEELADVLYSLFTLANLYNVDLEQTVTLKEHLDQPLPLQTDAVAPELSPAPVEQEVETLTHQEPVVTDQELAMPAPTLDLKAIAQRFIDELWNQRNSDVADELFAENCITNQLRSGAEPVTAPRTPAAVKKQVNDWIVGFPDFRYTVRQMLTDGDKVMIQCVANGTHQGTWLGIPATGKAISIETMITQRIADGKIVEDWVLADFLGLFQQLGLVAPLQEILAGKKN